MSFMAAMVLLRFRGRERGGKKRMSKALRALRILISFPEHHIHRQKKKPNKRKKLERIPLSAEKHPVHL